MNFYYHQCGTPEYREGILSIYMLMLFPLSWKNYEEIGKNLEETVKIYFFD
jgi:hypothetical protein